MTVKTPAPPALPTEVDRLLRRLILNINNGSAFKLLSLAKSEWSKAQSGQEDHSESDAGAERATLKRTEYRFEKTGWRCDTLSGR